MAQSIKIGTLKEMFSLCSSAEIIQLVKVFCLKLTASCILLILL